MSGIDDTIKIFSPEQRAQEDARNGINILNPDHPANLPGARRGSDGDQQPVGLRSCKRMHDSYRITSQNDIDRQGGMHEAIITVCPGPIPFFFFLLDDGTSRSLADHHPNREAYSTASQPPCAVGAN